MDNISKSRVNGLMSLWAYRLIGLFCILCLVIFTAPAEGRGVGTSGSAALKIGIGARATAMGEASVAVVDDVSSIYWNPAGLFQIRDSQLSAMHMEWLDDIRYEWLGYAQPLASWATIAADVSYVSMGSIARTLESVTEGYEQDGTFTVSDLAGRVAVAGEIYKGIIAGASFQVLKSTVDFDDVTKEAIEDKTAQSTAINLGFLYNTPVPDLKVGCSFQNMGGQTVAFVNEKEPLPFGFRLGVGYEAEVTGRKPELAEGEEVEAVEPEVEKAIGILIAAMDLALYADSSSGVRMGLEYQFSNGISVRGGYRTGTGLGFPSGLCGGAGYKTSTYQFDYAFVPYGDVGNTHRISFTIRF